MFNDIINMIRISEVIINYKYEIFNFKILIDPIKSQKNLKIYKCIDIDIDRWSLFL